MADYSQIIKYNQQLVHQLFNPPKDLFNNATNSTLPKFHHNLNLSKYKNSKFNFYTFDNHTKCATAFNALGQTIKKKEFINIKEGLKNDGIPVIWGNKNESKDLIYQCWEENIDFIHIDLPYLENWAKKTTAQSINTFRISINALHKNKIFKRPNDRLSMLSSSTGFHLRKWNSNPNGQVLICPPSEAMAEFYQLDIDIWLTNTIKEIRNHTNKPYYVRFKPINRLERVTLLDDLIKSSCMITYNSNAGVEALFHGVPVISDSCSATAPLNISYSEIDNPPFRDRISWASSIAYSQWHINELANGLALFHTLEEYEIYR